MDKSDSQYKKAGRQIFLLRIVEQKIILDKLFNLHLVSAILVILYPDHYDLLHPLTICLALLFAGAASHWHNKRSIKLAASLAA